MMNVKEINSNANYTPITFISDQTKESTIKAKLNKIFNDAQKGIDEDSNKEAESKIHIFNKENLVNDRMLGRTITYFQEIFISLKNEYPLLKEKYPTLGKEYQSFPSFNLWIKKQIEENFFLSSRFLKTIYFNALSDINKLKNDSEIKKSKLFQEEFYTLEYNLLLIFRLELINLDKIDNMIQFSSNKLDFIASMTLIDDSIRNKLLLIFLFIQKLLIHPKLPFILSVLEKTNVNSLISHPSLNIKFSTPANLIKEQLIKNLMFYLDHARLLKIIFLEFQRNDISFGTVAAINDPTGENIEKENVFSPLLGCRKILKEMKTLLTIFSSSNISLENYFEGLKSIQEIATNFQFFSMLKEKIDFKNPFYSQIFNNITILRNYTKIFKSFEPSASSSAIFDIFSEKNYRFFPHILDLYSYNFTLQLIKENKIKNLIEIDRYLIDVKQILDEIFNFVSSRTFNYQRQSLAFAEMISINQEYIQKYENKYLLEKLNQKSNFYEIFSAVDEIFETYDFLEFVIKDFILTEIKIHMFLLKKEKDENIYLKIKKELDDLTNIYDLCLKILNRTHKLFNLYPEDELIFAEQSLLNPLKNEDSFDDVNQDKKIEVRESNSFFEEIKNELTNLESSKINKIPSLNKINKKKKANSNRVYEENTSEVRNKSFYEEYNDYLVESGWKAHMKRRKLLQLLKQNGWKINSSSGKGSHTKVEGPNGTIMIVPHSKLLAKGTSHSIEESFLSDQNKEKERNSKKDLKLLESKASKVKKKKNRPKRK